MCFCTLHCLSNVFFNSRPTRLLCVQGDATCAAESENAQHAAVDGKGGKGAVDGKETFSVRRPDHANHVSGLIGLHFPSLSYMGLVSLPAYLAFPALQPRGGAQTGGALWAPLPTPPKGASRGRSRSQPTSGPSAKHQGMQILAVRQ